MPSELLTSLEGMDRDVDVEEEITGNSTHQESASSIRVVSITSTDDGGMVVNTFDQTGEDLMEEEIKPVASSLTNGDDCGGGAASPASAAHAHSLPPHSTASAYSVIVTSGQDSESHILLVQL
ncbi:unnamed protein product [Cyprideis torosa]|uniref:Uncharacterized protein n=1 Tax=Cyprideis torosa TaxID=163714 RepID=A0A7R8WLH0_9CRUS|nr:unnamed protein product [Cyprideis torosa]CAG0904352.1 unnamed protein product [Cyprideis torosa]